MSERALLAVALLGGILLIAWLIRAWSSARTSRLAASATLETTSRPRVMLFTSASCEACAIQQRVIDGLRATWRERVEVSVLDAVADGLLARQLGILMVPAVVVAAADGRVVGIKQGLVDEDRLRSLIEAAA